MSTSVDDSRHARTPLLEISDLGVEFASSGRIFRAVNGISISIARGERFGMVGETGAGKSLTAWAAIGLLPQTARMTSGSVRYENDDLSLASPQELQSIRGREIAIIVQNPAHALSPMTRIGDQLVNMCRAHAHSSRKDALERAIEALRRVGIPDPGRRVRAYPHELSIGMAQRVLIAMSLLHHPKLLIADEPTSGLDVTIQAEILDLLMSLVREQNMAIWLITHDLEIVANYCQRAAVLFAGSVVETGSVAQLFTNPAHPYTRGLVDSRLTGDRSRARFNIAGAPPDLARKDVGCCFAYRCPWVEARCRAEEQALAPLELGHEVRCWAAREHFNQPALLAYVNHSANRLDQRPAGLEPLVEIRGLVKYFPVAGQSLRAVDGVDLTIGTGQAIGLVGESGSGKSTLARCVMRTIDVTAGEVRFEGHDIARLEGRELRRLRSKMQMVFQDPLGSLDPRQTVNSIIDEPLRLLTTLSANERRARIRHLLDSVRLSAMHLERYPHQLSGGQQQRVGIARALATNPRLCVLDEPTSAVDWPIRAELLELLDQLRRDMNFSFLFISHDLGAVRYICDRVAVMYLGRVVEEAPVEELFALPQHPYSRALLSSMLAPVLGHVTERISLYGDPASPIDPPSGCRLHPRCPIAKPACSQTPQELKSIGPGRAVACMRISDSGSSDINWPDPRVGRLANV